MQNTILKGLTTIIYYVHLFNNALIKKYNLKGNPYNFKNLEFPSTGTIEINNEIFKYRYHGAGCEIESNKIKFDFITNNSSKNSINVSVYFFTKFLQSYSDDEQLKSVNPNSPFLVENKLNELKEMGILDYSPHFGAYELIEDKIFEAYRKEN